MMEPTWRVGSLCEGANEINLDKAIVLAEVYSRALSPDDGGFVACYVLAHDLEPNEAERAMEFFHDQIDLLVDPTRLVSDVGAEFPALVTIRYTDETKDYLATADEWSLLRALPAGSVSPEGWDLFCVHEAVGRGEDVTVEPYPAYDERVVRQQVLLNRAATEEDRTPWLKSELTIVREVIKDKPEGYEIFEAQAEDIEAVLAGSLSSSDRYSVIIPTKVERRIMTGAIWDWVPQGSREIVVAHGLDAVQAAIALRSAREDPWAYVTKSKLLSNANERETLMGALVVPDEALNWMSTDFTGRRDPAGYETLRARMGNEPMPLAAVAAANER